MRVKKYKRVKRPKVHAGYPDGLAERANGDDAADAGLLCVGSEVTDRPEESDSNEADQQLPLEIDDLTRERGRKGPTGEKTRNSSSSRGDSSSRRSRALVWPEQQQQQTTTTTTKKSGNQSTSDDDDNNDMQVQVQVQVVGAEGKVDGPDAAPSPADGSSHSNAKDLGESPGGATPRTSRCSEVEANEEATGPTALKGDGDDEDEYEEYEDDELEDSNDDSSSGVTLASGGGSLWFKAERMFIFLQLLALALDVDGAAWPPLFTRMWSWVWLTHQYLRWPVLILLRRVGREFSLTFGDAELELWFFRDVIGYGVEISAAVAALFVMFFVMQMPDYTSHKPKAAWQRSFLTHWFRRTLPRYVFNLVLSYAAFAALTHYGDRIFPPDVVTAVIVVGGTLLTLSWLAVVALSLMVHINVRIATKHDAEYSFMIAMVSGQKGGGRVVDGAGVETNPHAPIPLEQV